MPSPLPQFCGPSHSTLPDTIAIIQVGSKYSPPYAVTCDALTIGRSMDQRPCSWYVSTPSSTVMSMFNTTMFSGTRTEREAK